MQETQRGEASAEERPEERPDELNQRLAFTGVPLDLDLHHSKLRGVLQMPMRLQEVLAGRRLARTSPHTSPHTSPPAAGPAAARPPKTHQNHQNRSEARMAARALLPPRDTSPKNSTAKQHAHAARAHKTARDASPTTSPKQTSSETSPKQASPKTTPKMFRGAVQPPGGRTHLGVLLGLGVGNGDDTDTGHTAS